MNENLKKFLIAAGVVSSVFLIIVILINIPAPPTYEKASAAVNEYLDGQVYEIKYFVPKDSYATKKDYYLDLIALDEAYYSSMTTVEKLTSTKYYDLASDYNLNEYTSLIDYIFDRQEADEQMVNKLTAEYYSKMQSAAVKAFPNDSLIADADLTGGYMDKFHELIKTAGSGGSTFLEALDSIRGFGNFDGVNDIDDLCDVQEVFPVNEWELMDVIIKECYQDAVIQVCLEFMEDPYSYSPCKAAVNIEYVVCARYLKKVGNGAYSTQIAAGKENAQAAYEKYVAAHPYVSPSSSSGASYHITMYGYDDEVGNYGSAEDYADDWADDFDSRDDAYDYYNDNN